MRIHEIRSGVMRLIRLPLRSQSHIDADADAELASLLSERAEYLIARGMAPDEARLEALRKLGPSLQEAKQLLHTSARTRERRMGMRDMFEDLTHDLRYAFRTLRRDARFATFAMLIIGLGIGASVTVFSVANALLFRPLPFQQPDNLAWIENNTGDGLSGHTTQVQSLLDLAAGSRSFTGIAAYFAFYSPNDGKLTDSSETIRLSGVPVTQNFFDVLGVRPVLGRIFNADESSGSGASAVMLSYALWAKRYNGDRNILGRALVLNDAPVTVVGVLPKTFDFGSIFAPGVHVDYFTPFPLTASTNRWGNTLSMIGRLKSGVSITNAQADVKVVGARIMTENPKRNTFKPQAMSLRKHVTGSVQSALIVLSLAVGVVMLIVCANLSNLLLARATIRQKEMAVRVALGAGRQRLVRQLLTESIVLSLCGAALGLLLAFAGTRAISGFSGLSLPLLNGVNIDGAVVMFAGLLALITGVAFGIAPAVQVPSAAVHGALKDSSRSATGGNRGRVVRNSLVVSEIALACMLLVVAGLLSRSFLKVLDVDLGFKPAMVASMRVDPGPGDVKSQNQFVAYVNEVLRLSKDIPGVQSVAITDGLPLAGNRTWGVNSKASGYPQAHWPEAFVHVVSDGFMRTMGIKFIAGRDFNAHDDAASDSVIIVNASLARALWPGEDAIGKLMKADRERRVIGVVADVHVLALEKAAGNEFYLPIRQTGDFSSVQLVLRSNLDAATLAPGVRTALRPVAPNLATNQYQTMQRLVDTAVSPRKFIALLLAGFALFALLLALLGIYGVISYTVNHRTQEIGVRMALGASAGQLQARIIRETLTLAGVGMLIGTAASWALARTLGAFLFGVTATDPFTFVAMLLVLTVVAVFSGYIPARRASRIDPMMALRGS